MIYSCVQNSQQIRHVSKRDTILNDFLRLVDSLPYYDTNNLDYKILKAYKENDTLSLEETTNYIQRTSVKPWMHRYLESCAISKEFDTLAADEAYQFSYESSFCEYYTVANIIQRGDSIKASAFVYKNASLLDSTPCTIAEKYETIIDSVSWVRFQEVIFSVDFWGAKEDNEYHGVDGSSLAIQGYHRKFRGTWDIYSKRSYVSRWSSSMQNLIEPFMMLLRFCKISKGCIRPV